jgi:ActR/RegA family two-component response regulator
MVRKLFKQLIIEHDEMVEYQSVKQNEYELAVFNTKTKKLKFYKAEKKEFIEVLFKEKNNEGLKVIKVVQMNGDANKDIVIAFCNTKVAAIDMNKKKCMKNVEGNYANV